MAHQTLKNCIVSMQLKGGQKKFSEEEKKGGGPLPYPIAIKSIARVEKERPMKVIGWENKKGKGFQVPVQEQSAVIKKNPQSKKEKGS